MVYKCFLYFFLLSSFFQIVNNYAVCLFHARQPQEAVKVLEEYVLEHSPHKAMMDNLFLAYELESLDSSSRKEQFISRAGKP